MEKSENYEGIEQFARNYLTKNGIDFEKNHQKDECYFDMFEKYGLFYVEAGKRAYLEEELVSPRGLFTKAEYKSVYENKGVHRFVCDSNKNILIDLAGITEFSRTLGNRERMFLDEHNIIVPILDCEKGEMFQHCQIINGRVEIISTFKNMPMGNQELFKNKLISCEAKPFGEQLYNFSNGKFIGEIFCRIFIADSHYYSGSSNIAGNLDNLAWYWGLPKEGKGSRGKFVELINQKMKNENLVCGYNPIFAEKDEIECVFHSLVFVDANGSIVGDLYYMDNENLESMPVPLETYKFVLQSLTERAHQRVDEEILRRQLQEDERGKVLSKIEKKLSL